MRYRFVIPAFALLVMGTLSFVAAQAQQAAGNQEPSPYVDASDTRPAEVAYKNISVLKGIPANRLEPIMKTWKDSLGVQCTFCHVKGEWDVDSKDEKGYAREMQKLTVGLANTYFDGKEEVTCYTCHRGEKHPAKRLPAAPVRRQPRPVNP